MAELRTILSGATVIDGTGQRRYLGDVWIEGKYIARITDVAESHPPNWTVIPIEGRIVSPGFIDVHSHADNAAFLNEPDCSKIFQGVTTEVTGNCGDSLAPRNAKFAADLRAYAERLFPPTPWHGTTFRDYWAEAQTRGLVTNVAPLVGQGTLRILAMGLDDRPPTRAERHVMVDALRQSLDDGAFGLSTGLIYPPGLFTATEEIVELATCLGNRVYATHMRNEADNLIASVQEALNIGRAAHCPVQISHHKACGRENWGKTATTLSLVQAARQEGQNVRLDVYPYTASSTVLTSCLPPWVEVGGPSDILRRLTDFHEHQRIFEDIQTGLAGWENELGSVGAEGILISATPDHRWEGQNLAEISQAMGLDPVAAMLRILVESNLRVSMIAFSMDEGDLQRVMTFPWTMIGSDGLPPGIGGKPHPRQFGTFPRVLGTYVRERQWMDLETAVYKMTGLAADTFGLGDRGVIREDMVADLVVFDFDVIADRGQYAAEPIPPIGIDAVYLAGQCVVQDGRWQGIKIGQRLNASTG
ncbi:MAG: N-acyl-D-amino-acid deacylase [Sulfobacillus acidophilus]|uniref:N-acyl-D-amino-acid deacylase n=1 Tax=Sulfobacillus acidophilus TaxID=53633 RepID=A0A2T2WDW5_9FIRM|nr:MAG: N-acyl-D-amino-acid deacylase [Sulfobacillus acidophilus]